MEALSVELREVCRGREGGGYLTRFLCFFANLLSARSWTTMSGSLVLSGRDAVSMDGQNWALRLKQFVEK